MAALIGKTFFDDSITDLLANSATNTNQLPLIDLFRTAGLHNVVLAQDYIELQISLQHDDSLWIAARRQQLRVSRCPYSARHSLCIPGKSNRSSTLHVPVCSIHPAPQCNPDSARHQRRTKQTPTHSLLGTWDRGPQSLGTE
jgi:hypothetical protein